MRTAKVQQQPMTPEQRDEQLDALVTIAGKHSAQIEGLTLVAERHTGHFAAVDARLEALLRNAEQHNEQIAALTAQVAETSKAVANLEKQWQAYINTLPR